MRSEGFLSFCAWIRDLSKIERSLSKIEPSDRCSIPVKDRAISVEIGLSPSKIERSLSKSVYPRQRSSDRCRNRSIPEEEIDRSLPKIERSVSKIGRNRKNRVITDRIDDVPFLKRMARHTFDPPVALHVAAAFRLSRNCAKAADGELQLICILAFSRHNFSTEGFFETPHILLIQEKPSTVVCWFQRTLKQLEREQTDTQTDTVILAHARRGLINPRRACAARVTCVSVCQCVQASHPLLTQLQDQVDIPMDSVSCSLQIEFGRFSYNGLVSKIAIALPHSRAHGSRPFLHAKRAHFPHSFRILRS